MSELVPFQRKRKKLLPITITPLQAVSDELLVYLSEKFPQYLTFVENSDKNFIKYCDEEKKTLYSVQLQDVPRPVELARIIAPVTSPELINDSTLPWTHHRLDSPVITLYFLAQKLSVAKPICLLPKPYQAMMRKVYSDVSIRNALAINIASARRASKYLRILQKRLGIYSKKKTPFKVDLVKNAIAPQTEVRVEN